MKTHTLFGGVLALGCTAALIAADRPNVLFIAVDDLKPLLGCYGDPRIHTPGIDRLAARGIRFDRAYTNQAVCAPSRNALMTGLRPDSIGVYDLATFFRKGRPDALTLPQHFKARGYRSESLGKLYHLGHGNSDDAERSWSVKPWYPRGGSHVRPSGSGRGPAVESADVPDQRYTDGMLADEAIRRLDAAKADPATPFFLGVGFLKPHLPFCAPEKYWKLYTRDQFRPNPMASPPAGAPAYAATTWGELRQYEGIPPQGRLPDDLQAELIHGYHAAVSFMDAQVGRVLDHLEKSGLADRTIIVLWGDHGWHLGDHGFWCKHTNYEQATRIPLLISAPGITPGVSKALVETVDLYPTLCELAGLPVPEGLDGTSLRPLLENPALAGDDQAIHVYPRGPRIGRAIRTARHRLVEWKAPGAAPESAEYELYDYQTDPAESRNLASEQPEVVAALKERLNRLPAVTANIAGGKPAGKAKGKPAGKAKPKRRASAAGTP